MTTNPTTPQPEVEHRKCRTWSQEVPAAPALPGLLCCTLQPAGGALSQHHNQPLVSCGHVATLRYRSELLELSSTCSTSLLHLSAPPFCFTPLLHFSALPPYFTPLLHLSSLPLPSTSLLYLLTSPLCSTSLLYLSALPLLSTSLLHLPAPPPAGDHMLLLPASSFCVWSRT